MEQMRESNIGVRGEVDPAFEIVAAVFERVIADRPGFGAAVCAYVGGQPVVDLWGGEGYGRSSTQLLFSATKGLAAVVIGTLVQAEAISLERPVASYWPEFAHGGKGQLTVGDLMAHKAGLPAPGRAFGLEEWCDGTVADALAAQEPAWPPGTAQGYHGITVGALLDGLTRRVAGRTVGELLASEVGRPLGVDAFIGLPPEEERNVTPVVVPAQVAKTSWRGPLVAAATSNQPDVDWNDPAYHRLEFPAANGIASARALAKIYAACVAEVDGIGRLLDDATVEQMTAVRAMGPDLVLELSTRFGAGFQLSSSTWPMTGTPHAFGHDGFGGSAGFADRRLKLSFGFTTNRMPAMGGADLALFPLVAALVAAAQGR